MIQSVGMNMPLFFTLTRLILSPLVLPWALVYGLQSSVWWLPGALAFFFAALAFTDFLDGHYARKRDQISRLGAVLDPIADKFLLYSAVISLVAAGKLYFYWAIIFIGREFFIMGLRHVALECAFAVNVSSLGKLKTAMQITALTFVILNPYQSLGYENAPWWNGSEFGVLSIATILTIVSAYSYFREFMKKIHERINA